MPLGQPGGVTDIILPNGSGALAVQHILKSLPGQVIIIQEKVDSLWRSDAALSVTLSATTGFVVLILGFAFHWQSTRAREGDLINDAVRGRIDRRILFFTGESSHKLRLRAGERRKEKHDKDR